MLSNLKVAIKDFIACIVLLAPLILWFNLISPTTLDKNPYSISTLPQHISSLPWYDRKRLQLHIQSRLPRFRVQFEEAAEKYNLSWILLAAQAYQESRWDPNAKSSTGVRGLMMLTKKTASSLGVTNRLDPDKSIDGGARYLAYLEKWVPEQISHSDRIWFALAAYNVGMGHIKDAQKLAQNFDINPNSWKDLKKVLPLLAQKQHYKSLHYGYARGWEPVHYVQRIRELHALLEDYLREI